MATICCILGIFIFVGYICSCVGDCSIEVVNITRYGPNCEKVCHCKDNAQCDTITGVCPGGKDMCEWRWFGPSCQYKNLPISSYQQSTIAGYGPYRAQDNSITSCSVTVSADKSNNRPWWRGSWFPSNSTITDVYLLTKDWTLKYFQNFEVQVDYYTDHLASTLSSTGKNPRTCYKHNATSLTTLQDFYPVTSHSALHVQCYEPLIGNTVAIKLATFSSQLVLCDIRVLKECPVNTWGHYCENTCDVCRLPTACDPLTGKCYGGCPDGFKTTDHCDTECSAGKYGFQCQYSSPNCLNDNNEKVTGTCLEGCKPGFLGERCEIAADCSVEVLDSVKRFAHDCSGVCHCQNEDTCDTFTAECPNGCASEWFGPACLKRDAVSRMPSDARQSSERLVDPSLAEKARDDDKFTCSFTIEAENSTEAPWWKLFLTNNETITDVYLITSKATLNFYPNFIVTVEYVPLAQRNNNSYYPDPADTHTCYQHDNTVPTIIPVTNNDYTEIQVACDSPVTGNQVRIQLATVASQLEMCDVLISKVCDSGKWGPGCANTCGACRLNACDIGTGLCYGGCQAGYTTTDTCLEECEEGRYGYGCQSQCSLHCKINPCNKKSGICTGGCSAGYIGEKCDQECTDGTYGIECNQTCSADCLDVCNKVSGLCTCKAGWQGALCDQECDAGTYGDGCLSQCTSRCPYTCDRVTGFCSSCELGRIGNFCELECDYGKFGLNCAAQCGHCMTNTFCDRATGVCHSGCMEGYTGPTCLEPMEDESMSLSSISGLAVGGVAIICVTNIVVCVIMYKKSQLATSTVYRETPGLPG